MSFADDIKNLQFEAKKPTAEGFMPPMFRAITHVTFATACIADEPAKMTDNEVLEELRHASEHWNAIRIDTPAISAVARTTIIVLGIAIADAIAEFPGWERKERIKNLKDLCQRAAAVSAFLDRELIGLTDSDPGLAL